MDHYNGVYYVIDLLDYTRPHTHVPGPGGLARTFIFFFMNLRIINNYCLNHNKENNVFKDALGVKGLGFKHHGNHPGNHGSHYGNHHGNSMKMCAHSVTQLSSGMPSGSPVVNQLIVRSTIS